jgi:anti-sigma factor RsiW
VSEKMNVKCETVRTLLVSLADHELAGPKADERTRHLEQCAECRALLEALKQDRETLRQMPAPEPPDRLLARVMRQVQELGTAPEFPKGNSWGQSLRVAAIILLFLTGIALGVVIGYAISPRDARPIDRIAVLMMNEPTGNPSEVQ